MKKLPFLFAAICAALLLLFTQEAGAQANSFPPGKLTYQGFLTDALGVPIGNGGTTNTSVTFRIFGAVTGGTLKWSEQQTVTIDNGHFSVLLGEGSPVGTEPNNPNLTSVFSGSDASDRFMEITVGTTVINPRLQFQPAPYAMLANSARQIVDSAGSPILTAGSSVMTFNGTVTATSVAATNVTSTNIFASVITSSNFNAINITATNFNATNITATTLNATNVNATNIHATTIVATNINATTVTATFVGNGSIPIGGIIMWSGSTNAVPAGWTLCNGVTVNGVTVPNLQNRFIVGAGTNSVGATGGKDSYILTSTQVPLRAHTHSYVDVYDTDEAPAGSWSYYSGTDDAEPGGDDGARRYAVSKTTGSASLAATDPVDNRPQFYALAYIMRVQ